MERDWEKRRPAPTVPRETIEALLRRAGIDAPLLALDALDGGCVNHNLRLRLGPPRGDVVLRLYLREAAAASKEAALLTHLAGLLSVPRVLATGTLPPPVTGTPGPVPWLLLSWIPGRRLDLCWDDGTRTLFARAGAEIGRALGRLHAIKRNDLGFLDAALDVPEPMGDLTDVWRHYVGEMLASDRARARLGVTRQQRLTAFVREHDGALAPLEGRYSLLHADCKPTNVFVDERGALTGLIDWEFAWAGPPLFDLGQMLRWPVPAAFEEALLASYAAAGGRVTGDWRMQARLLDLMNLVGFLEMKGERPTQVRDVLALVDRYLTPPRGSG